MQHITRSEYKTVKNNDSYKCTALVQIVVWLIGVYHTISNNARTKSKYVHILKTNPWHLEEET